MVLLPSEPFVSNRKLFPVQDSLSIKNNVITRTLKFYRGFSVDYTYHQICQVPGINVQQHFSFHEDCSQTRYRKQLGNTHERLTKLSFYMYDKKSMNNWDIIESPMIINTIIKKLFVF